MTSQSITHTQQSTRYLPLRGIWKLEGGRAITLQPCKAGLLRVEQGRIWATFDGPHGGPRNDMGDRVLGSGSRLALHAGQRLVIESWTNEAPVYLTWDSSARSSSDVGAMTPNERRRKAVGIGRVR